MESFSINSNYAILIQLEYEGYSNYIMCGSQIRIQVTKNHNIDMYTNIYNVINLSSIVGTTFVYLYMFSSIE